MAEIRTYDSRVSPPTKTGEVIDTVSLGLAVDRARLIQAQGIAVAGLFGAAGDLTGQVADVGVRIGALNSQAKLNKKGQDFDKAVYEFGLGFAPQEIVDPTEDQRVISGFQNAGDTYQGKWADVTTTMEGRNYAPAAQRFEDWASDPVTGQASEQFQNWSEAMIESHLEGLSPREQQALEPALRQKLLNLRQQIDEKSLDNAAQETKATNYVWANNALQNPNINDPYDTTNKTKEYGERMANEVALGIADKTTAEIAIAEFNLQMRQGTFNTAASQIVTGGWNDMKGYQAAQEWVAAEAEAGNMSPGEASNTLAYIEEMENRRWARGSKEQQVATSDAYSWFYREVEAGRIPTKGDINNLEELNPSDEPGARRTGDPTAKRILMAEIDRMNAPSSGDFDASDFSPPPGVWEDWAGSKPQAEYEASLDRRLMAGDFRQAVGLPPTESPFHPWAMDMYEEWRRKPRGEQSRAYEQALETVNLTIDPIIQGLQAQERKKPGSTVDRIAYWSNVKTQDVNDLARLMVDATVKDPEHAQALTEDIIARYHEARFLNTTFGEDYVRKDKTLNPIEYYAYMAAQGKLRGLTGVRSIAEASIIARRDQEDILNTQYDIELVPGTLDVPNPQPGTGLEEGQWFYKVRHRFDPEGPEFIVKFDIAGYREEGVPGVDFERFGEEQLMVKQDRVKNVVDYVSGTVTQVVDSEFIPYDINMFQGKDQPPPEIGIFSGIRDLKELGVPDHELLDQGYTAQQIGIATRRSTEEVTEAPETRTMLWYDQWVKNSGFEMQPRMLTEKMGEHAASPDDVYPLVLRRLEAETNLYGMIMQDDFRGKTYEDLTRTRRNGNVVGKNATRNTIGRVFERYGVLGNEWYDYILREMYGIPHE